jgi:hypothetical protein
MQGNYTSGEATDAEVEVSLAKQNKHTTTSTSQLLKNQFHLQVNIRTLSLKSLIAD